MQPTNAQWAQLGSSLWMGGAKRPELCFVRGSGSRLWDAEGREYLDFVGGWAVCGLGHSPAVVAKTLAEQASTLLHCSPGYWNPPAILLSQKLSSLSGLERAFIGTTGAEANECAIKLARKHGASRKAFKIVTTIDGFHGRTLATMSATGKAAWKNLFGEKVPGFVHVPANDIAALESAVTDDVCAVMFEPVQGEGGVVPFSVEYAQAARKACDKVGALLVFDEVQTGMGRCGSWFAFQNLGVRPDVLTLGKGLGAGYPLSACLTDAKHDGFEPGDQGGTFTYHPLGAAVGLAVIEEMERLDLVTRTVTSGNLLRSTIQNLSDRFGLTNLRGQGLLQAFDLSAPDGQKLVEAAREEGFLLNSPRPSTIRLMPPLVVTDGEIEEFGQKLERALRMI
ncbi:MAG: acetylornithine aminotransferase [Fibrobacterota bacterium]|jgi:acetylornithine/N-succinyldiaminopimelate aminotransferase